jgi:hypothetical protein
MEYEHEVTRDFIKKDTKHTLKVVITDKEMNELEMDDATLIGDCETISCELFSIAQLVKQIEEKK